MIETEKGIEKGIIVFNLILVAGFLGLVWLIIYGNLSGNLGFTQDSLAFSDETIVLQGAGSIPAGADNRINGELSSIVMTNATGGEIIAVGNYTTTGVTIFSSGGIAQYNNTNVNVSYTVTFDSTGQLNTEAVIDNLTAGVTTFFGFSVTWFTIIALVILITILLSLLALAVQILRMVKDKDGGFASE